jgi:hypothetical protein
VNRQYVDKRYSTVLTENAAEGFVVVELLRTAKEATESVARIVFWDSVGQYFLEPTGAEIPLSILEEFIAEAKAQVRVPVYPSR